MQPRNLKTLALKKISGCLLLYYFVKVQDTLRIPPSKFGEDLAKVLVETARETFEGRIDSDLGFIVSVTSIENIYRGKIVVGDGGVFYAADFGLLCYIPQVGEIIEGEIVENTDFGAFVRIGTIDALCHVSQIADDYFRYIPRNSLLRGDKSKRDLQVNTRVRGRIIAVSIGKSNIRVGLTMRQNSLGAIDWIEEWKEKLEKAEEEEEEKGGSD